MTRIYFYVLWRDNLWSLKFIDTPGRKLTQGQLDQLKMKLATLFSGPTFEAIGPMHSIQVADSADQFIDPPKHKI